jgi:hypothetical protein
MPEHEGKGKTATGENLWGGASHRPTAAAKDCRTGAKFRGVETT